MPDKVDLVAKIIAATPLIDAPKLPPECWHGLARQIVEAVEHEAWQPIETAPKDRMILVFAPAREGLPDLICSAIWHEDAGFCVCELRHETRWMPLPSSPSKGKP